MTTQTEAPAGSALIAPVRPQRWTGSNIHANHTGGFVAIGDYLALERAAAMLVVDLAEARAALRKANDQAEHFERLWYLTKEDADRYAFAKTLEGQVVTMETFKVRGAAELDQALDDAMAGDADARNDAGYAA